MSVIKPCSACGRYLDVDVEKCPHCGAPRGDSQPVEPASGAEQSCLHCGRSIEPGVRYCANCGHERKASRATDDRAVGAGVLVGFFSCFLYGAGFIVSPLVGLIIRKSHPNFAKGLFIGVMVPIALLLGALTLCVFNLGR